MCFRRLTRRPLFPRSPERMSLLHTGAKVTDAIKTGAHLPYVPMPSLNRATELSAPSYEQSMAAASLYGTGDSLCNNNAFDMYASQRMMGNPAARRMAQGQGDAPPVITSAGPQYVNYETLSAAVQGRHMSYQGTDTYRDEYLGGFIPASQVGMTAAPVRAEVVLDTVSVGLSTTRGGEILNPRPFVAIMTPPSMNLTPQSESAATRAENACRLTRMNTAVAAAQLAAPLAGLAL